ncbi:MAG: hypothetical protein KatS3mg032_1208 [Cyclobacteriaceae bacterium]|nr:MAG: hypothetical protein KatS3mg032_1208 [Cyclobacteriaceae bacterium]
MKKLCGWVRISLKGLLPALIALYGGASYVYAQPQIRQGQPIVCAYDHFNPHNLQAQRKILHINNSPPARKSSEDSKFEVRYTGFTPEAQAAFQYAVDIWSSLLKTNVKIRVFANWAFLENINTLAFVTPTEIRNFSESPQPEVWYPMALAEKLAGRNLNSVTEADIVATFNSRRDDWYFGLDGNCPPDKFDLVSVVLHELGHGLGFSGTFRVSSSLGFFGLTDGKPKIYDTFLQNGLGQYLTSFQSGTLPLANQITSNSVTFESFIARTLASSVANPRIFAPNPYQPGSSISHLDENTYENTSDALMTPYAERGKVTHGAGPHTKGMLYQMGWLHTVIQHTPMRDQEVLAGKKFQIKVLSDTAYQNNSVTFHYSYDGFSTQNQVIMSPLGEGWFEAEITSPIPESTISYYFDVLDIFNRKYRYPLREQQFVSFYYGVDTQKPVIVHNPVTEIIQFMPALTLQAAITDNIGLEGVVLRYRVNEGAVTEVTMTAADELNYSYVLGLSALSLKPGDKIEYQIEATDSSSQRNVAVFPPSGWVTVTVKTFEVKETYVNNFSGNQGDFYGDFTISTPTGFVNPAIHSPHPYPKGTGSSATDLVYTLLYPVKVAEENATIEFDEVVLVEPGTVNDYTNPLFGDYVIVEASADLQNWVPLTPAMIPGSILSG